MSRPYTNPARTTLLAAVMGRDVADQVPRWMDRRFGYTPKKTKGGKSNRQRKRK